MTRFPMLAACLATLAVGPARAQPALPQTPGSPSAAEAPITAAMDKMSSDMAAAPLTGDADRDFTAMMIPHHQGAIAMAQFELAHGKDPAMLGLARDIIAAQEKETAEMKGWQAEHAKP